MSDIREAQSIRAPSRGRNRRAGDAVRPATRRVATQPPVAERQRRRSAPRAVARRHDLTLHRRPRDDRLAGVRRCDPSPGRAGHGNHERDRAAPLRELRESACSPPARRCRQRTTRGVGARFGRVGFPYRRTYVGLRAHVHGRAERQDLRETPDRRVAQPDAAVADARADQPGLVRAVQADTSVAAGERLQPLRVRREAERVRAVRAVRVVRLEELDDVEQPARCRRRRGADGDRDRPRSASRHARDRACAPADCTTRR